MPSRTATPAVMLWCTMSARSTSCNAISTSAFVLEVEREAPLAALAAEERLTRHAHAVTGHRLDLDHVGAEVADHHRAERTGEVLAEVDQPHTFERMHQLTPANFAISAGE